nr:hypothetical protein [Streptococcus pneumoniae]
MAEPSPNNRGRGAQDAVEWPIERIAATIPQRLRVWVHSKSI